MARICFFFPKLPRGGGEGKRMKSALVATNNYRSREKGKGGENVDPILTLCPTKKKNQIKRQKTRVTIKGGERREYSLYIFYI